MLRTVLKAAAAFALLAAGPSCATDPYPGEQGTMLHVGLRLLPKSLDPAHVSEEGSGKVAAHLYDGLLQYHPYARPYRLEPALAAAMPEVSDDRLDYTFTIRPGVHFVDDPCFPGGKGREVTAQDFLFAFKRLAHPTTKSEGWWLFDGWIAGLNDWRDGIKRDKAVRQIAAAVGSGISTTDLASAVYSLSYDDEGEPVLSPGFTEALAWAATEGAPYWKPGALLVTVGEGAEQEVRLTPLGDQFMAEEAANGWQVEDLWMFDRPVVGTRQVPVPDDPAPDEPAPDEPAPDPASPDTTGDAPADAPAPATREETVRGFEVLDDHTFRVRLERPYPQLLWVLAMTYTSVYPPEAIAHYGREFRTHPVGTGPFRIEEFNPIYRAVLTRNETFRDVRVPDPANHPEQAWEGWEDDLAYGNFANPGAKVPLVDGMEIRFILEDQPRWLYFKAGYLDFLNPPKDNIAEALPRGELSDQMTERGVRVYPWPELGTVYSCLNTEDPVLSNVDLRRAIALAFDHKWTVDNLYSGQAIVATSLIPPGVAGFDRDYHPFHTADGGPDYERAKEYLAKAGYPGGRDAKTGQPLTLVFDNSGASQTAKMFANRFIDDMRRIGIGVREVTNTFPQMVGKMRNKNFQVAGLAWGFDYPDAQNILQLLYGPNASPGPNAANFHDEAFDRLYEQAAVMEDSPERTLLYEQMTHIVADEVPWITRAHRIRQNLQQPWLSGFKFTETSYGFWRYSGIDRELRDQRLPEWNEPVVWPVAVVGGGLGLALAGMLLVHRRRT